MAAAIARIDKLINYLEDYLGSSDDGQVGGDLRIPHATPVEAFQNGQREKVLFVTATRTKADTCSHGELNEDVKESNKEAKETGITDISTSDFIAVVNVDPLSKNYCQIINELPLGNDLELHHFGWNSCAGCLGNIGSKCKIQKRRFLIAPAFSSGDVFIIDTNDISNIKLHKKISGNYLRKKYGVTWPHTSHCLANGNVMMSFLGFDSYTHHSINQWLLFNGNDESFNCLGKWIGDHDTNDEEKARFSYDFWYQPYHNIMISSEWGHPKAFSNGFNPNDVKNGLYGHSIHLWNWEKRKLIKTFNFKPNQVTMALETRFLHNPKSSHAFINGCLTSNIIHIFLNNKTNEWECNTDYIKVQPISMENWILPTMPGLITDILISMDDKYLYFANWLHGDIRQYNISDPFKPILTGQVFLGGLIRKDNIFGYKVDLKKQGNNFQIPNVPKINNNQFIQGGPQMLQLSLDGKRLYATNSLFSPFDKQFYPNLINKGGMILMCDVDHKNGGLKLNEKFCVDFGKNTKSGVPARPHEMRYPGGDCTSDIFIDMDTTTTTKNKSCGCN